MPAFNPPPLDPRLAELLTDYPPHLFTEQFYQSVELTDRYCLDLAIELLQRLDIALALKAWHSVDGLCRQLDFSPRFRAALEWLLARVAVADLVEISEEDGARSYRLTGELPPSQLVELRQTGLAIDPANAATLDLLDAAAAAYPTVARGTANGEQALFGMGQLGLWLAYFHNGNPTYAVNNWVGAMACVPRLAEKARFRILELGAGAGSGTSILLQVLNEQGLLDRLECYRVTEPNAFFRRRGERELKARYPDVALEFRALDIDRPWEEQDVARDGFDLVYGVNVLHVATDLVFSLKEARATLAPSGWLVIGECLRQFPGQPIYAELIFKILDGFSEVKTDPEIRPEPGFLTPWQWQRAFARAGFEQIGLSPDQERIRAIYPRFFTGAIWGR